MVIIIFNMIYEYIHMLVEIKFIFVRMDTVVRIGMVKIFFHILKFKLMVSMCGANISLGHVLSEFRTF